MNLWDEVNRKAMTKAISNLYGNIKGGLLTLNITKLTRRERRLIISELAERWKNIVFLRGKAEIEDALSKLEIVEEDTYITVQLSLSFVGADLIEILGGIKRKTTPKP